MCEKDMELKKKMTWRGVEPDLVDLQSKCLTTKPQIGIFSKCEEDDPAGCRTPVGRFEVRGLIHYATQHLLQTKG